MKYIGLSLFVFLIYFGTSITAICLTRCGRTWYDATTKCGQCCQYPTDCTEIAGEKCYRDLNANICSTSPSYNPTSYTRSPTASPSREPTMETPSPTRLNRVGHYGLSTTSSCGTGQRVSLTFDDGPAEMFDETLTILNKLDIYGIRATFFVSPAAWGDDKTSLDKRCLLIRDIINRGHEVQSHSWSHPNFAQLSDAEIIYQLDTNRDWIVNCGGVAPTMFRPPYGSLLKPQAEFIVQQLGYVIALWNLDSNDWMRPNDRTFILNEIDLTKYDPTTTSINLLMHDRSSYQVIDYIVEKFINAGYEFILQSECWSQCDTLDLDGVCMDYTPSYIYANTFPNNFWIVNTWRNQV